MVELPSTRFAKTTMVADTPADTVFYPATGFPVGVYTPFLTALSDRTIDAVTNRACLPSPPPVKRGWQVFADDLHAHLQAHHQQPVVGIGHSLGASTMMMVAAKHPELFRALVVIEPAQVDLLPSMFFRASPLWLHNHYNPARRMVINRARTWESRAAYVQDMQQNPAFRRISSEAWSYFSEYMVTETTSGQFKTVFDAEWEAIIYSTPPYMVDVFAQITVPMVVIRGKPSMFFSEKHWQAYHARQHTPNQTVFNGSADYGHLIALEAPELTANMVQSGLQALGI